MSRQHTNKISDRLRRGGTVEYRQVAELRVDHAYQRALNDAQASQMAKNLDLDLIGIPAVVERANGEIFVFDGMHRKTALSRAGLDALSIRCHIYRGLSLAEEAALFYYGNTLRKSVSQLDLYRAQVQGGDHVASLIHRFLERDLEIPVQRGRGTTVAPGVRAIAPVTRLVRQVGPDLVMETMRIIRDAWGDIPRAYDGEIVNGVAALLAAHRDEGVDPALLVRAMSRRSPNASAPVHSPKEARDKAAELLRSGSRVPKYSYVSRVLAGWYNEVARGQKRLRNRHTTTYRHALADLRRSAEAEIAAQLVPAGSRSEAEQRRRRGGAYIDDQNFLIGGTVEHLMVDDISVDHRYQRDLNLPRAQQIADDLMPMLLGIIVVVRRPDGSIVVIDGQHRLKGLQLAGRGQTTVLCEVYTGLTPRQEADLFWRLNEMRIQLQQLASFRSRVVAEDPTAVEVKEMLDRIGIKIGGDSGRKGSTGLFATRTVEAFYRQDPAITEDALSLLQAAWANIPGAYEVSLIGGMVAFLAAHRENDPAVDADRVVAALTRNKIDPGVVLAEARMLKAGQGGIMPAFVASAICTYYNEVNRRKSLPEVWTSDYRAALRSLGAN